MNEEKKWIPRTIWILWYQGVSEAPFIVRKCIDSWTRYNPTWEVVVLDSNNLQSYIKEELSDEILDNLSLAHQSDLVRLQLLSKYGGVWADATTFCIKSLDEWIDRYAESGLFVFHKPGKDRIMSNWFIASKKDSPACAKLYNNLRLYWVANNFSKPNRIQSRTIKILSKFLNQSDRTTKHWLNPIVTRGFRIYPYFVFHYMFERLVSRDEECKDIWRNTKKISADLPLLALRLGLFSRPSKSIRKQLNNKEIPLFKLTWKYDHSRYHADTLLYYLLEEMKKQET